MSNTQVFVFNGCSKTGSSRAVKQRCIHFLQLQSQLAIFHVWLLLSLLSAFQYMPIVSVSSLLTQHIADMIFSGLILSMYPLSLLLFIKIILPKYLVAIFHNHFIVLTSFCKLFFFHFFFSPKTCTIHLCLTLLNL